MDKITYLNYLSEMSRSELEDYLEAVWKEEIEINEAQEKWLQEHLEGLRVSKAEVYVKIFILLLALLAAVAAYDGVIKRLVKALPEPKREDYPWDLMWHTEPGACEKCKALDGKIYGRDFFTKPDLHPNCRCSLVRVNKGTRAMDRIGIMSAGAIRTVKDGKKRILEVLAAPFGSPERKDKLGQFLSPNTNFMIGLGEKRPLLYFHGFTPRGRKMKSPPTIGTAITTKLDDKGLWMRAELNDHELADRTWNAALDGNARASTGSVNYLEDHDKNTGEVYCWPIAELSVFDGGDDRVPVSDDAIVLPLRAIYQREDIELPFDLEAGEDNRALVDERQTLDKDKEMEKKEFEKLYAEKQAEEQAEQEKMEAMRAEIRKEEAEKLKSSSYRSTFNINSIDDKAARKNAADEEEFAYVRALLEDAYSVANGGMPIHFNGAPNPNAKRTLEETEAAELGSMVPDQLHNKIKGLLGKYSLIDKMVARGLIIPLHSSKLTFTVPAETTAMVALADIAEEGAYTANEMAFAGKQATMQKVGNYLKVTEEALDDQELFQSYLPKACAKAIALSKNADLYTLLATIDGTEIATEATITDAEIVKTLYYGLAQEYRENACFIMNDETLGYVRSMLVATPRAYGEFGFAPMSMGELGEKFLNHYVFTNSNWTNLSNATQDDLKIIDFVDLEEAIAWVERKQLSIFVDPYSTRLSAGTINFLPNARYGGVVTNAAALSGLDGHEA